MVSILLDVGSVVIEQHECRFLDQQDFYIPSDLLFPCYRSVVRRKLQLLLDEVNHEKASIQTTIDYYILQ